MKRCPNCKARYKGGENCHRCGMEFKWLLTIQDSALALRSAIIKALTNEDYVQARKLVRQHQQLIKDPLIDAIAIFLEPRLYR